MKGVEPLSPPDSSDDHSIGPLLAAAPTPPVPCRHSLACSISSPVTPVKVRYGTQRTNPNCCYDVRN